jgi:uncharacterized DUF497 family protein
MFEWDKSKANKNLLKRGIHFADTFAFFDHPNAVTLDDNGSNEQRYITIGMDAFGRILWWSTHGVAIIFALFQHEKPCVVR